MFDEIIGTFEHVLLFLLIILTVALLCTPWKNYINDYFNNKVVWITGASSGIGRALAIELAQRCPKVSLVLSARREDELEKLATELNLSPNQYLVLPLDLQYHQFLPKKVELAIDKFRRVDVLINNGGISQRSLLKDTGLSVDSKLINVNLLGTVTLSKALLPKFIEQKHGHYAVVTSASAYASTPMRSTYAASKIGLHAFFDSLRLEHKRDNIDVTMVVPGFVRTDISKNALEGSGRLHGKMDPKTDQGTDPFVCAREILQGIAQRKHEIYVGHSAAIGVYLRRFCPWLLYHVLLRANST